MHLHPLVHPLDFCVKKLHPVGCTLCTRCGCISRFFSGRYIADSSIRRDRFAPAIHPVGCTRFSNRPLYQSWGAEPEKNKTGNRKGLPRLVDNTVLIPQAPAGKAQHRGHVSMKFHNPNCSGAKSMKEKNKVRLETRDQAIEQGYEPCNMCQP